MIRMIWATLALVFTGCAAPRLETEARVYFSCDRPPNGEVVFRMVR